MRKIIHLALRLIPAIILFQTLFFKFTGAKESVYIFSSLGVEPWGRYLVGIMELLCGFLLLIPGSALLGSLMGIGLMLGALSTHVMVLGYEIQGDGGLLFQLACVVLGANILYLWSNKAEIQRLMEEARTK